MRKSICTIITSLLLLTSSSFTSSHPLKQVQKLSYTQDEIDNAWIVVPWSHGGYYYHNTLTREDRDDTPLCLLPNYNN